ncbi:MAG: extracellular solute-binding protein [Clostridiales bacterium]|nr:extracellular solute-binding protein [Clostridiales bacterium]
MKKIISLSLIACLAISTLPLAGCTKNSTSGRNENVLRVASWDEYIDEGGSFYNEDDPDLADFKSWFYELTGVDLTDSKPLYEEFEDWYQETYGKSITVEYIPLQDNETMYNKIKMGDHYDLLCPSEYMAMKLKSERKIVPFDTDFYNPNADEHNYYAKNVSAYTSNIFKNAGLTEYIAGYMWGTTGFVFNPEKIDRSIMNSWNCLTSEACTRSITAKDNVRDSYFMGLGMYYEEELLTLKESNYEEYKAVLSQKMNDTSETTMAGVKKLLEKMRKNIYGLETDEGKTDVAAGRLDESYQWSGDAVFILDEAESEFDLSLEYSIPDSASNLWFDGWVMMEGANKEAAKAFINFLSRPDNAIRNMYYIGYTSCLAGEKIYEYLDYAYGAEEDEENTVAYDLSYFFGEGTLPLTVAEEQTRRQLFAQYPDSTTIDRLVVMNFFDKKTNERANRMWNNIK